jgi:hypothetical protein
MDNAVCDGYPGQSRALIPIVSHLTMGYTQTFRFKTRVQQLNSIEASSRAKVNFLKQLYRFHKQQGNPRVAVPSINHKPLDLWRLRKEVQEWGGYDMVKNFPLQFRPGLTS